LLAHFPLFFAPYSGMCNTLMGRGNVQEAGRSGRKALGIEIIAADSPGAFVEDTPTATLVRQVLGAVAQFDKAMTVAKLRLARDRVRKRDGKCEGRKSHAEERPEAVALAKQLHKQGMGYRAISGELAKAGHVNERGKPFHHAWPPETCNSLHTQQGRRRAQ